MPAFGPVSRSDLIRYLKELNFSGPYSGKKHQYMVKGEIRLIIPNPHKGDISKGLLSELLKQAGIDRDDWEAL